MNMIRMHFLLFLMSVSIGNSFCFVLNASIPKIERAQVVAALAAKTTASVAISTVKVPVQILKQEIEEDGKTIVLTRLGLRDMQALLNHALRTKEHMNPIIKSDFALYHAPWGKGDAEARIIAANNARKIACGQLGFDASLPTWYIAGFMLAHMHLKAELSYQARRALLDAEWKATQSTRWSECFQVTLSTIADQAYRHVIMAEKAPLKDRAQGVMHEMVTDVCYAALERVLIKKTGKSIDHHVKSTLDAMAIDRDGPEGVEIMRENFVKIEQWSGINVEEKICVLTKRAIRGWVSIAVNSVMSPFVAKKAGTDSPEGAAVPVVSYSFGDPGCCSKPVQ